ncbi:hypothetical protein [Paraburkholderia sp. MM6662-R1]|uniref:hypothetical protein n=1 Tax=Paraburkholderia sp. MM6662-R1 TaxID=2991066 RepID=UPI003D223E60
MAPDLSTQHARVLMLADRYPNIHREPVRQTRGPGRRPKCIPNLFTIRRERGVAEQRAREPGRVVIETAANGIYHVTFEGRFDHSRAAAIKVARTLLCWLESPDTEFPAATTNLRASLRKHSYEDSSQQEVQ